MSQIRKEFENLETSKNSDISYDAWKREEGGGGKTFIIANGSLFDNCAVNFSSIYGNQLPDSALPRSLKKTIKKLEPEFKKNSKLFHSKKEVEDLYQNISNFALANGLSIVNLKKADPVAVSNSNTDNSTENQNNDGQPNALYFKPKIFGFGKIAN